MACKKNKHKKQNIVRVAEPVAEAVCDAVESPCAESWETTPPCDETQDAEAVAETVCDAVESPCAENWETTRARYEAEDVESVSENVGKHDVTAGYDSYNVSTPVIHEYDQPETRNIAGQIRSLQEHRDKNDSRLARFPEVDDDIGHTFIHYLYTGDYQTLKPASTSNMPWRAIEYKRSVLAYSAGIRCGVDGLVDHGRKYMEVFDKDVSLFDMIDLGRECFPKIDKDPWYSEYLTNRIMTSFESEEGIFERDEFFRGFGEAPDFDIFLGRIMAKAYSRKISLIRAASNGRRMDKRPSLEMAMNGDYAANGTYECASTRPKGRKERFSHVKPHINLGGGPQVRFTSSRQDEAWSDFERDENNLESSRTSVVTPDSCTVGAFNEKRGGETTQGEASFQSGSDLDRDICPHWKQHSMHENSWKSCQMCKSYILNMFTRLFTS
ncbi:hypothetical protein CBS147347_10323 [Aspergillus niger]|nr:hypothetical protein CBS147347_10323 [Aspergillus niger]